MQIGRVLAGYELFAAGCAALLAVRVLSSPSDPAGKVVASSCAGFALLSGLAGALLWTGKPAGHRLGIISEALRVLRFATPWLSYYAFAGLDLNLGLQYFRHGVAGLGADPDGGGLWLQANVVAIVQFAVMREPRSTASG